MIKSCNEIWGIEVPFESKEEMEEAIKECGYDLPIDGLVEGVDYIVIDPVHFSEQQKNG